MEWVYPVIWLALIIVFVVVEAATVQLVSIWLAVGALAALVPAMMGMPFLVQIFVFLVISALCLVCTRPFVRKVLAVKKVNTNADRVIGRTGLVTETVDNSLERGRIMVDGLSWKAKAVDNAVLESGTRVTILAIQGVTLIVKKA